MRISDFSFWVASSTVFQTPTGELAWAAAAKEAPASRQATTRFFLVRIMVRVRSEKSRIERHHRRNAGAGAADEPCRLGQQLGEVEARRRQLGDVERVARRFLVERHLRHPRPQVGEDEMAA